MKAVIGAAALLLTAAFLPGHADAAGCLKGAVVGGAAGHYAGNHEALGAGAGCLIGRHHANEKAQQQQHMNNNPGSGSSTASQNQNQNH